jgi:hypothetical protein
MAVTVVTVVSLLFQATMHLTRNSTLWAHSLGRLMWEWAAHKVNEDDWRERRATFNVANRRSYRMYERNRDGSSAAALPRAISGSSTSDGHQ